MHVVIWDEISMTGQTLFARASKILRKFLNSQFGVEPRINIVTAGDCGQFPSVFENDLFEYPAHREKTTVKLKFYWWLDTQRTSSPNRNIKASNKTLSHLRRTF